MENKTKGMRTCKVCGRDFPLIVEEHYSAKEASPIGLAALSGSPRKLFDAFDCPHCGCQNVIQERFQLSDITGRDYSKELNSCSCEHCPGCDKHQEDDEDDPICQYTGGECYCKGSCDSTCEFHPDYKAK